MKSDRQKNQDEKTGLFNSESKFDIRKGKILRTGSLKQEFDPEQVKKDLPGMRQGIEDQVRQIESAEAQLSAAVSLTDDEKKQVEEFIVLQKKSIVFAQREQIEAKIKEAKERLLNDRDILREVEGLVKEYDEWKAKGFDHLPKSEVEVHPELAEKEAEPVKEEI